MVKCPKCSRVLPADGELTVQGTVLPVYECPECLIRTAFLGSWLELPLVFVLGPDGRPMDPANPSGEIDLTPYD